MYTGLNLHNTTPHYNELNPLQLGLATLSAGLQRGGGSSAHPEAELNARLDELAAAIEAGAGPQVRAPRPATLKCPTRDVNNRMDVHC